MTDAGFTTDIWLLGRAFSATTTEFEQQLLAGVTITVSRMGWQQMGSGAGSQQTVSFLYTGSQQTGSQQAALRL
jgi:hypothetical protein